MMPEASIWEQYTLVAVIVVIMVGLYTGVVRIWKMAREAQQEENVKRDQEREKQRAWQAEQNALREVEQSKRDKDFQNFYERANTQQISAISANSQILSRLVDQMQAVTLELRQHDTWARERLGSSKRKSSTGDILQ